MRETIPDFVIAIVGLVISALLIGLVIYVHREQQATYVEATKMDRQLDGKEHHAYREGDPYGSNDEWFHQDNPIYDE